MIITKSQLIMFSLLMAISLFASVFFNSFVLHELRESVIVCGDLDARIRYLLPGA